MSDYIESKPFHGSATLYAMINISKPFAWRSQRQSGRQTYRFGKSFKYNFSLNFHLFTIYSTSKKASAMMENAAM
jgi:hypothetical protein